MQSSFLYAGMSLPTCVTNALVSVRLLLTRAEPLQVGYPQFFLRVELRNGVDFISGPLRTWMEMRLTG